MPLQGVLNILLFCRDFHVFLSLDIGKHIVPKEQGFVCFGKFCLLSNHLRVVFFYFPEILTSAQTLKKFRMLKIKNNFSRWLQYLSKPSDQTAFITRLQCNISLIGLALWKCFCCGSVFSPSALFLAHFKCQYNRKGGLKFGPG